ncbi:MAG: hypothetical protein ACRC8S_21140 [Fimbriiglobus sp.]
MWALAIAGDTAEAYRGLRRLAEETQKAQTLLRCYWLLKLNPSLDAERTRHDWLFEILVQKPLNSVAVELYRQEVSSDPSVALTGKYIELLSTIPNVEDACQLARIRVVAAGLLADDEVILADLQSIDKRRNMDHDAIWLSLLVEADGWAVWLKPPPGLYYHDPLDWVSSTQHYVTNQLTRLTAMELSHDTYFDRVEYQRYFSSVVRRLSIHFNRIMSIQQNLGYSAPSDVICGALSILTRDRLRMLEELDRLEQTLGSEFLMRIIYWLQNELEGFDREYPIEHLRTLASYIRLRGKSDVVRLEYVQLLIKYRITPREIAEAVRNDPDPGLSNLNQLIGGDYPVQILCLATFLTEGHRTEGVVVYSGPTRYFSTP